MPNTIGFRILMASPIWPVNESFLPLCAKSVLLSVCGDCLPSRLGIIAVPDLIRHQVRQYCNQHTVIVVFKQMLMLLVDVRLMEKEMIGQGKFRLKVSDSYASVQKIKHRL